MAIDLFKYLYKRGKSMISYSLARAIGIEAANVKSEFAVQYNRACSLNLNYGCTFLCNLDRMSAILGIERDFLDEIIEDLKELKFIDTCTSDIEDITFVFFYQNNIISYLQDYEYNDPFIDWDAGLKDSLSAKGKKLNFCESTLKIRQYLDMCLNDSNCIPLVHYSYFDAVVKEYEKRFGNILETTEILNDFKINIFLNNNNKPTPEQVRLGFESVMECYNNKLRNPN